jgi:uncharacterized protein (TIGR03437 family)
MKNHTGISILKRTAALNFRLWKPMLIAAASLCLAGLSLADTAAPPQLITRPDTLFFRQTGALAPPAQAFSVTGQKGNPAVLTVTTSGASWLVASLTGAAVHVSVNTTGLTSGQYKGVVTIAAAGFTSTSVNVSLTISGDIVVVDPTSLNLSTSVGGEADPRSQSVEVFDQNGSPLNWTAAGDQPWLVISPNSGSGKSAMRVSVDPSKVTAAGTLIGHVTVTDTGNATKAVVTVTLTASAAKPPNFQMGPNPTQPSVLNFTTESNLTSPTPKTFYARNFGGGGALSYTMTGTVNSPAGGSWLSFTPASNTTPGLTTVRVNPASLPPGNYSATITGVAKAPAGVTGGNLTDQTQVYLKVLGSPVIRLTSKFLRFTTGATTPPLPSPAFQSSQTVSFATNSTTGYPYVTAATTARGGNWLSVSPATGTAVNGGTLTVSVSAAVVATLAPGFYTGQVQVTFAGGSPTTERMIGIGLRVFSPTDSSKLVVNPGGILFVAPANGANPAAKNVNVRAEDAGNAGIAFKVSAAVSTPSGGNWLSVGTASGTATSTPTAIAVSANIGGLSAGTYAGTLTFTPATGTNAAVIVANVNLTVAPAGSKPTGHLISGGPHTLDTPGTIASGSLVATITDPPDNFTGSTDSAFTVGVSLVDSAGNAVPGANVIASSSNGEPDLSLDDFGDGTYAGLFQPANSGTVTLTIVATAIDSTGTMFQSGGGILVSGDVESAGDVATPVFTSGAVGSASFAAQPTPITPGGLVSLFGTNIAPALGVAATVPLPASLAGVSVTIGGIPAPLFGVYPAIILGGNDQINLQVPFAISGQPEADIVVTANGVVGAPQTISLGVAPAFFTQNSGGTGDGSFVHTDGVTLITPANPAFAGETIVLYGTGLGDVVVIPANFAATSAADAVTGSIRVTIGGVPATIAYAGLAPLSVGEYQINVVVPASLPAGENNVIVFINGNPATGRATIALR